MESLPDGPVLPASESDEVVLRPPRTLRYLAYAQATAGTLLILAAAYALWIQAIIPAACIAFLGVTAIAATLSILFGKVKLGPDGLHNNKDSVGQVYMAWEGITKFERRRRLWTEGIGAVSPATSVTLGAPIRLRFHRDRRFEAAVADLSKRSGREVKRGRSLLTWRYVFAHVAILSAWTFVFVTFDPIWHHQSWPGRVEASAVPDACRVLVPAAKQMATTEKPLSVRDPSGRSMCRFDTISLSLEYRLHKYALGRDGGIEQAEQNFRDGFPGPAPDAEGARPLPGIGDEATLVTSAHRDPGRATQVQIAARKGNVTIWLSYTPRREGKDSAGKDSAGRDSADEAVALAERLVRTAADRVVLG